MVEVRYAEATTKGRVTKRLMAGEKEETTRRAEEAGGVVGEGEADGGGIALRAAADRDFSRLRKMWSVHWWQISWKNNRVGRTRLLQCHRHTDTFKREDNKERKMEREVEEGEEDRHTTHQGAL